MAETPDTGIMIRGLFIATLCNLVGIVLALSLIFKGEFTFLGGFGILQFVWLLPLWFVFKKMGKTEDAKGALFVAGITILLNAACWAGMKSRISG